MWMQSGSVKWKPSQLQTSVADSQRKTVWDTILDVNLFYVLTLFVTTALWT